MVKMININFGNEMWVDEARVDEYKAKGHKVVSPPPPPEKKATRGRGRSKK